MAGFRPRGYGLRVPAVTAMLTFMDPNDQTTAWLPVLLGAILLLCGCAQNRPVQLISGSGPIYPAQAKAAGIQGDVTVRYNIAKDGRVIHARVDNSQPEGVFDKAALAAVRSWRYNPKLIDGQAQQTNNVLSTIRFRLDDNDAYDNY